IEDARLRTLGNSRNPLSLEILLNEVEAFQSQGDLLHLHKALISKGSAAVPRLIEKLVQGPSGVRPSILFVLGEIGDVSVLKTLEEMRDAHYSDPQLYNAINKLNQ
ncbi:MAG: hypothetical protein SF123_14760, partial [Chloroflexota bacterium]|nr:hypothetical protein [Chloroflexota bacterium]